MSAFSTIELLALLRLQKVPLVGDINAKRLLERCGSAEQIFKERKEVLKMIDGIEPPSFQDYGIPFILRMLRTS